MHRTNRKGQIRRLLLMVVFIGVLILCAFRNAEPTGTTTLQFKLPQYQTEFELPHGWTYHRRFVSVDDSRPEVCREIWEFQQSGGDLLVYRIWEFRSTDEAADFQKSLGGKRFYGEFLE